MASLIDLTGQTIGRWTVLGIGNLRDGRRYWHCECVCGKRQQVCGDALRRKNSRGCYACGRKSLYAPEEALLRTHYSDYKRDALRRGYAWELTMEQAIALFRSPCQYCGQTPGQVIERRGRTTVCTGIDRERNDEGYTLSNSVPCCKECNFAKGTRSRAEFTAWIKRAAAWLSA